MAMSSQPINETNGFVDLNKDMEYPIIPGDSLSEDPATRRPGYTAVRCTLFAPLVVFRHEMPALTVCRLPR